MYILGWLGKGMYIWDWLGKGMYILDWLGKGMYILDWLDTGMHILDWLDKGMYMYLCLQFVLWLESVLSVRYQNPSRSGSTVEPENDRLDHRKI